MSTGSVIAIVAANLVALAAIAAGFWQQRRGFAHERKLADLESVRDVLSQAAALLHRVEYALDDANSTLIQWGGAFFGDEGRAKPYRDLEEVGRETDALLGQLQVRLGPDHPATLAFGDADAAMLDAFRALGLIRLEDPPSKGERAKAHVDRMLQEQRERISSARENFGAAQEQFVRAAHAAAGADL